MIKDERLILVGGTGRNMGKTEFVCRLIATFAHTTDVFALKVSAIFPDEELFHGNHTEELSNYRLFEEVRHDTTKDTSRMLRAGAKQVFYLQSDDAGILENYHHFRKIIPENAAIICESNSLGYHVVPALHIVVHAPGKPVKPRAKNQLRDADLVVYSDGCSGFPELNKIHLGTNNIWRLKQSA